MKPSRAEDKRAVERGLARRRTAASVVLALVAIVALSAATSSGAKSWAHRLLRDAQALHAGARAALADNHRAHQRRPATVAGRHSVGSKLRGVRKPFPQEAAGVTVPAAVGPGVVAPVAVAAAPASGESPPASDERQSPTAELLPPVGQRAEPPPGGIEPPPPPSEPELPPTKEPESPPTKEPESPPQEPETPPTKEPEVPTEEPETPSAEEPETPPAEEPEPPVEEPEPPPAEEPEPPPPAGGDQPLFSGKTIRDFAVIQAARGAITEVPDPLGSGETVLRMTVDDSDVAPVTPTENPRAQALSPGIIDPGDEFWLKTKFLVPRDFPTVTKWLSLVEIHGPPFRGSSPWQVELIGDHLQWRRPGTYGSDIPWEAPLQKGAWVTLLLHERFASDGFVEMWINGQPVTFFASGGSNPGRLPPTTRLEMQTMDASNNGGPNAAKIMNYRQAGMFESGTIYFGPLLLGATRAAVGG